MPGGEVQLAATIELAAQGTLGACEGPERVKQNARKN
jgi:hypothetical protein